jgi:RNA polymerase sigma-70 factor (ECF subfamily)
MKGTRLSREAHGLPYIHAPRADWKEGEARILDLGPEVVRRAKEGDRDAFETLYRTHHAAISRLCRFYLGPDGEDAVADVFYRAWRGLPRYRETGAPFAGWLYGIARHVAVDELRRRGRSVPVAEVPDRPGPDPMTDEWLDLRRAIAQLPGEQRRVVEMKFLMGLTNDEVAGLLGTTPGAVNAKQWRALRTLAHHLEVSP